MDPCQISINPADTEYFTHKTWDSLFSIATNLVPYFLIGIILTDKSASFYDGTSLKKYKAYLSENGNKLINDPLTGERITTLFFAVAPCIVDTGKGIRRLEPSEGLCRFVELPKEFFIEGKNFAYDGINFHAASKKTQAPRVIQCQSIIAFDKKNNLSYDVRQRWLYSSLQLNDYIESQKENNEMSI